MAWPLNNSIHWETEGHSDHPNGRSWEQVHAGHDPMPSHPVDPSNPPPGWKHDKHGFGSLIRDGCGARITYWRNLYAHNCGRCPRPGPWDGIVGDPKGMQLDFINNVIFNWGSINAQGTLRDREAGNERIQSAAGAAPVAGQGWGYGYDAIGDRLHATCSTAQVAVLGEGVVQPPSPSSRGAESAESK